MDSNPILSAGAASKAIREAVLMDYINRRVCINAEKAKINRCVAFNF